MTGYLIPIKAFSPPALAAVRFALEFGKRNGGTFFFLFVDDPGNTRAPSTQKIEGLSEEDELRRIIEAQIAQARTNEGLQVSITHHCGDFIQEVRQFVRDKHIGEIIIGVPDEPEDTGAQTHQDALLLNQLTHCRILTVKPKAKDKDPSWNLSH